MNVLNTFTTTELRNNIPKALNEVEEKDEAFYIISRSRPKAVLLNVDYFNKLREMIEDYKDIVDATERLEGGKFVEFDTRKYLKNRNDS